MKIATLAEVKKQLSAFVEDSKGEPVLITRDGRPVAVLLAVEDEDALERVLLGHSSRFRDVLKSGREQLEKSGGIPHDEFWKEPDEPTAPKPRSPRKKKA